MPLQGIPINPDQAKTIGAWSQFDLFGPARTDGVVVDSSAGGSASLADEGTALSTDATASEYANGLVKTARDSEFGNGLVILYLGVETNQAIGSLAESIEFGFLPTGGTLGRTSTNSVVFAPDVGDSTAGNVVVHDGSANNGTLNYPTLNGKFHHYAIAVDLANSETRFHADTDPLDPGAAGATVSAVPTALRAYGAQIVSAQTDAAETVRIAYAAVIKKPP